MDQLSQARQSIEKIDKEMARLYEKRMDAVCEVWQYKKKQGLCIEDKKREESLLARNVSYIKNKAYRESYIEFMQFVMNNSKKFQKILKGKDE